VYVFFSVIAGATSVVAQILVAFSASLARDAERGRVVGNRHERPDPRHIASRRTVAGYVAAASSWRVVYFMAAAGCSPPPEWLWRELPRYRGGDGAHLSPGTQVSRRGSFSRRKPVLRRRALYGALSFAAFTVLWTSLAFLLAAPP